MVDGLDRWLIVPFGRKTLLTGPPFRDVILPLHVYLLVLGKLGTTLSGFEAQREDLDRGFSRCRRRLLRAIWHERSCVLA